MVTILLTTSSVAQIARHTFYVDGSFNYSKKNNTGSANNQERSIQAAPNIGFFINERILLGVGINYSQINTEGQLLNVVQGYPATNIESITKTVAPLLFVKYIKPINDKFSFAVKGTYQYGLQKTDISLNGTSSVSSASYDTRVSSFTLSPEILFFISKRIGMQVNFNGLSITSGNKQEFSKSVKYTDYTFSINPSTWNLGLFLILGRKQL
ncbi:outer membrane beta-barrel protein [Rhodocytophaga rosea]|uniref:Outer membrane beta-barrel protein n=1 Tax=Rhodocytophaga rosea TaxID=2704465 RepID=A0A6C0GVR4_9BACT|nr:outer membrane beta-barrel protein [Rhodocytophaga rosea]QHT71422.1 outer membrane beta-barrel protein [Rhodocytophaga rosea]